MVSDKNYVALPPTVSRVPAGFHIFFTPRSALASTRLCSRLATLLGEIPKCGFSKPQILSERFASTATFQYYHGPSDLLDLPKSLGLCPGTSASTSAICDILSAANSAAYVDYDYDAISHALNIAILSNSPRQISAQKLDPDDRLEVGILNTEKATEPEEISLGGFLTVVGEDEHPSATLFSFPARHHPLAPGDKTVFAASFQSPTGLHPKMDITFPRHALNPPKDGCALHAYFTLPSFLFIDRYAFADPLFLASHNLVALRSLSGEEDLEAPDWVVEQWGSAALFELAYQGEQGTDTDNWTVTIPMHLRYVNGSGTGPDTSYSVALPVVFWACAAEESSKMATNPFDRTNLGYDGLIEKAMFYHVPAASDVVTNIEVPVMKEAGWAPTGTAVVVLVAFLFLLNLLRQTRSSEPAKAKTT